MMQRPISAGVIGLGVGERHVIGYNSIPSCRVLAVCDIDPVRLKEVADRHDVPRRHTDFRRLVEDPDIDVVSICSYDDSHAEQTIAVERLLAPMHLRSHMPASTRPHLLLS